MFVKEVVDCMKRYHFCINKDECTFNNSQKIFSIHMSYFDIEIGKSVVQHYKSVSSREGNVKSLLECICNCFIRDDIQNLVSDLSDSTNYVRRAWTSVKSSTTFEYWWRHFSWNMCIIKVNKRKLMLLKVSLLNMPEFA